ncbi:MAG: radical SAM protein [Chloroflexota bacterium]|nr:radical SAM protein [Chloroflexota bacterium]
MAQAEVQEITCKSLLNRIDVPGYPFRWTLNPYRGCRHACRYCYARPTHEFWGMNSGEEFDQRVFAKVNAAQVLRDELRRPKWKGEPVAIGTASDPYEPAEAQYKLTRQIIQVLADLRNPASITTKGVLVRRDVDVLRELYHAADVQVIFSVGSVDEQVWRRTEPGTPSPIARLEAMQFLVESGIPAGVMMAPLLPGISDSAEAINETVQAAARHHAQFLSGNLLFLKPGSREWFMPMLRESYPHLTAGYLRLYRNTYADKDYTESVLALVEEARRVYHLPSVTPPRELNAPRQAQQLALIA